MDINLKAEEKMAVLLNSLTDNLSSDIIKFLSEEEKTGVTRSMSSMAKNRDPEIPGKVINEFFPETLSMKDGSQEYFVSKAGENPAKMALLIKCSLSGKKAVFNDIEVFDNLKKSEIILETIRNKEKLADTELEEARNKAKNMMEETRKKCETMLMECKNKGKKLIDDVKSYRDKLIEDTKIYCTKLTEEANDIYEQQETSDPEEASEKAREIVKESQMKSRTMIADAKTYCEQLHKFAKHEGFEYGKTLGMETGKKEGTEILREALKIKNYFLDERNKFFSNLDSQIADMAISVAEKLIRREVTVDQNIVLNLVKDRLNEVKNEEDIILRVNPEDCEYLNVHESELRKMLPNVKNFKIEGDDMIEKGGCVIATTLLDCNRLEFHLKTLKLLFEYEKNQSFLFEGGSESHV